MRSERPYSLLYDGDCRICTAFARGVQRLDVRRRLRVRPIQESTEFLAGLPAEERLGSAHAVSPDGHVSSGAAVMPALVAALVAGPRFERRLRDSRSSMAVLSGLYRVMREMRGRLSCATSAPASAGRIPR